MHAPRAGAVADAGGGELKKEPTAAAEPAAAVKEKEYVPLLDFRKQKVVR